MINQIDLIVIGAGPAGMMAAGTAAEYGKSVLVFDKNEKLGRKLRITGKGRCNVTNNCDNDTVIKSCIANGRFLYSALSVFNTQDCMEFFENLGVKLKTERGNRVFPVSDDADEIADAMVKWCEQNGVKFERTPVTEILTEDGAVSGVIAGGKKYKANSVLIATGGASYKATGSTGDGYKFAESLGHSIKPITPSLSALTTMDADCPKMQGLSLRNIAVKVIDTEKKNKVIFEDFGEMLFTHFGISGPVILSASSHMRDMKPGRFKVSVNLKPALDDDQLDKRLLRDLEKNLNRNFSNSLDELLPQKMIDVVIERSGIAPDTKCNSITKEQRKALFDVLRNFEFSVNGFRSLNEAIVTGGGVNVKEVNPKTMESKLVSGLFFAGEVLDVDAYTGGFNLQIAFCTGRLAGINA
ncbi:MAG: NAD(P)/FAD-dependent oxidoreductase [Clostridia bacterium]|nr:NAD(P)/FAD-dependent oxidoreductase [Clostridia bacterium]